MAAIAACSRRQFGFFQFATQRQGGFGQTPSAIRNSRHRGSHACCHATPIVLKSPPTRVVAPSLQLNLRDCCAPSGTDRVTPIREFDCRSSFSTPSTVLRPPVYQVESTANHNRGRKV